MRNTEEGSYGATEDYSFAHKFARTAGGEKQKMFRFHQMRWEHVNQESWRFRSAFHALAGGKSGPGVTCAERDYCVGVVCGQCPLSVSCAE